MTLNIDLEQPSKTYRRLRTFGRIHVIDGAQFSFVAVKGYCS